MANGDDFDWDNPVHKKNPFINRDPRLCETILLDGDDFQGRKAEVFKEDANDKRIIPKVRIGIRTIWIVRVCQQGLPDVNSLLTERGVQ